jgi:TolB-like protein
MKTKGLLILIILAFSATAASGPAWGGQVVTDDARSWAKQAVAQEKALKVATVANTVAVLYFFNRTGQPDLDPLQKGLTVMLITDLSKVKSLTVVERIRLQALAEELKLGVSGLVTENTAPRVGRLLGAYWLVGGNLLGGQPSPLQIKSNVLDVPTSQITGQPGAEGVLEELLRMEKDLVFGIIKFLKIVPTPQEEIELKKPITINVKALFDFSKCIDLSDRKDYEEASKSCEKALKEDPNFGLARDTLNELRNLGLPGGGDKSVNLLRSLRNQTSLTNQLTPHESDKRLVTPATVNTMEGSQPPTPEPRPQTPISQPTSVSTTQSTSSPSAQTSTSQPTSVSTRQSNTRSSTQTQPPIAQPTTMPTRQ